MCGVLFAETTVFAQLHPIGVVLLVLHCIVISLFALGASQCDLGAHRLPPTLSFRAIKKGLKSLPQKRYL